MKTMIYLFIAVIFYGCSNTQKQNNPEPVSTNFDQEIEVAMTNQDFRLYGTTGRRVTIPGINVDEYDYAKAHCGIKHLPNTGDVLKSEEQRIDRNNTVDYMKEYNRKMLKLCLDYKK